MRLRLGSEIKGRWIVTGNAQSVPRAFQAASTSGPAFWRKALSFIKEPLKCWRVKWRPIPSFTTGAKGGLIGDVGWKDLHYNIQ